MQNSGGGDGAEEDPNQLSKLTVPGYKWRLVIAYDGTRFSGLLQFIHQQCSVNTIGNS